MRRGIKANVLSRSSKMASLKGRDFCLNSQVRKEEAMRASNKSAGGKDHEKNVIVTRGANHRIV
jgi:hypothetical protein